jgi:hypothetical protein
MTTHDTNAHSHPTRLDACLQKPGREFATIGAMKFPALASAVCACGVSICTPAQTVPAAPDAPEAPPATVAAPARTDDVWRLMYSPATYHYSRDPDHHYVWMVGVERERPNGVVSGFTYFSNSFGQPSAYAYVGQRLTDFSEWNRLYAQWTAGMIYGYKAPFDDKVPLNYKGFSPGLVLTVGWQLTPTLSTQVNVLGNSALMFQLSAVVP